MRVISNKALIDFGLKHPLSIAPLQNWRSTIQANNFEDFAEIKRQFNAADKVKNYFVFDVGGNKYRIIVAIHFNHQRLYIRHVFTHQEYDKWVP